MLAWAPLAAILLAPAQRTPVPVIRSFDRVLLLEDRAETSAGVSVGDLNGDGLPDIALGKGRHWPLFNRVLLNDGHGGFVASDLGTAPDRSYSAALADVDGDGHLDIVVSNDSPDHKLVYRNDGEGHFTEFGTFGNPKWSTRYITDLNRDKRPDIIVGYVEQPGSVFFNTGRGGNFREVRWNDGKGTVYGLAFADFNRDGWPDIVAARSDARNAIWFSTEPRVSRWRAERRSRAR